MTEGDSSKKSDRIGFSIGLLIIVALAVLVRCHEIDRPWISTKDGGSAHAATEARNYLKHGYLETRLGPVDSLSRDPQKTYQYYLNHPPLRPLIFSIAFLILGESERSARISGIFFSVLSVILLCFLAREMYGRKTAVFALIFLAFMPGMIFYASANFFEVYTGFGILLTLYSYLLWVKRRRTSFLLLAIAGVLFGGSADWPFYFIFPGLVLSHFFVRKDSRPPLKTLLLLLFVIGLVGGFWSLYLVLLSGSPKSLYGAFLSRVGILEGKEPGPPLVSFLHFFKEACLRVAKLVTAPILLLALLWLPFWIRRFVKREVLPPEAISLSILLVPILNVFFFVKGAWIHEFWSYYFCFPAALFAARLLSFFEDKLSSRGKWSPVRLAFLFSESPILLLFAFLTFFTVQKMYREANWTFYDAGRAAARVMKENERILIPHSKSYIYYYPEVECIPSEDVELLKKSLQSRGRVRRAGIHYCLMSLEEEFQELNRMLFQTYGAIDCDGVVIFDLCTDPDPHHFKSQDAAPIPLEVIFGDMIKLTGMKVIRGEYKRDVKVQLFWECLSPMEEDYSIHIRLLEWHGKTLSLLEKTGPFYYGLYPTSEWSIGDRIRTSVRLADRKGHLPGGPCELEVEVLKGTDRLPVHRPVKKPEDLKKKEIQRAGRARIGKIKI